jgi:hypothetical protein
MKRLILTAIVAASPLAASAMTGMDWVSRMNETSYGFQAQAIGYVHGVADSISGTSFCPPSNMTPNQAAEIVLYSVSRRDDPRLLKPAYDLVKGALDKAYPCKK